MNRLTLSRVRDEWGAIRLRFSIDGQPFERIFEGSRYLLRDSSSPPWELMGGLVNDIADIELRNDFQNEVDRLQQLQFRFDGKRFHAPLLTCTCGEDECWCAWCSLEIRGRSVAWRGFKSGQFMHDDARVAALNLEFEFDREQYVAEFVRFCTEAASIPHSESTAVLDAGFSDDGRDFIVTTSDLNHVWSLEDGSYRRATTLWEVDYQRRGDTANQDGGQLFLSGSTDPRQLWRASAPDEATVQIVSARTDELLIELRFDPVHARWLALDVEGLYEIHGSLSYPTALPTALGPPILDRGAENLRKGLLAATLKFDRYRQHAGNSDRRSDSRGLQGA